VTLKTVTEKNYNKYFLLSGMTHSDTFSFTW